MLYLTNVRARGFFGMLLLVVMSLVNSSLPANSQSMFYLQGSKAKIPEKAGPVQKTILAFKASELFLAGGTAFDMTTTARGLNHPTTAYRSDGSFLTQYYVNETGWAAFLGKRDAVTAVTANVLLNAGIDRFSRRLYARGGRWRKLALGTVLLKGALNTIAASNNIRNDNRIDDQVRLATGYQGTILWHPR
jgi:hypothetical protein